MPSATRSRPWCKMIVTSGLLVSLVACTGVITEEGAGNGSDGVNPAHMTGAGGRDISEYWPSIEIALSQNTRMLSFEMMRSEVLRATGQSWLVEGVDQWERNRSSLGGADYVTTFTDDLTPSQQRIVLWRKMAFQVCGDLVRAEAGAATRTVFSEVDPGASFDASGEASDAQIRALFRRFFVSDADETDVAEAVSLLAALSPTGSEGENAWTGLCVAYLGSMRFLTY